MPREGTWTIATDCGYLVGDGKSLAGPADPYPLILGRQEIGREQGQDEVVDRHVDHQMHTTGSTCIVQSMRERKVTIPDLASLPNYILMRKLYLDLLVGKDGNIILAVLPLSIVSPLS